MKYKEEEVRGMLLLWMRGMTMVCVCIYIGCSKNKGYSYRFCAFCERERCVGIMNVGRGY